MNFIKNLLGKPDLRIKFDNHLQSHIVVKSNEAILFVGTKEKCKTYLVSHAA